MDPQAPSGNSMSLLEKCRAAVQHCPHSSPHCHLLAPCRHCSLSQSPPKNGDTTAMGHSELYAELDTWILGLSPATETFREIEPVHSLSRGDSLSPRFWEFLLAMFSLYAKTLPPLFSPLFCMLQCSTLGLLLLHGNSVQPCADFHPDHLHRHPF